MKITVEYDLDVEGQCDAAVELLKHLGIAGTPAGDDFVILANSIEIKDNYQQLQVENEKLRKTTLAACADEKALAKGQMTLERKCVEAACNRIIKKVQALKDK